MDPGSGENPAAKLVARAEVLNRIKRAGDTVGSGHLLRTQVLRITTVQVRSTGYGVHPVDYVCNAVCYGLGYL